MEKFTIHNIESLCNIKAHTLRVWEKRYHIMQPDRKKSKHRLYSNNDLKFLLRLSFLYHKGIKISKIASLSPEEFKQLTQKSNDTTEQYLLFINDLIDASIDFNENAFEAVFENAIKLVGLENTMRHIIYPYFEKIGLLWMNDAAIPAQEHFSSNIIRNKLIFAIDAIKKTAQSKGPTILLFSPEEEFHEIPLLFICFLLLQNNWKVTYFSTNVTRQMLEYYCTNKPVDYIYMHPITNLTRYNINQYTKQLLQALPHQQLLISGPLVKHIHYQHNNLKLLLSAAALSLFIKTASL
jgi:MerR family transcriptional regulator, light-induced transcriptional regulator